MILWKVLRTITGIESLRYMCVQGLEASAFQVEGDVRGCRQNTLLALCGQ